MTASCARCRECVIHCHGTLIVHAEGVECTEPDCVEPDLACHDLVIDAPAVEGNPRRVSAA